MKKNRAIRVLRWRDADASADEAIKELVLIPLVEEPRVLEDVVNTWEITNWRSLNKKERGPIFQAGGFPWYELL